MKKNHPPLRNYQQMIRIVQEDGSTDKNKGSTSYKLANAYGETEAPVRDLPLRLRTLDELGLPSTSIRRPGPVDTGGDIPLRASTSQFHQLNSLNQTFFNGLGGPQVHSRKETQPGTKVRSDLGSHSISKKILPTANLSPMTPPPSGPNKTEKTTSPKKGPGKKSAPD